ncbi:MAG: DinB family protein [Candidatus Eiseniibacteriota bacterium]|nr:MAG: DinB family protein [Candidatus Eisenbacteria bacterium]
MDSLSHVFDWNSKVTRQLLEGFAEGFFSKRFEGANSAHWLIGHLAVSRREICDFLNIETDPIGWREPFDMGSSPEVPDDCPPPVELLDDFLAIGQRICAKIQSMSADDCERPMRLIVGNEERTVLHNLHFMYWHESYHVGQIGMIRRMLGLERMA